MMTWIKIGIRNLYKNKRRSLFTISAIALGLAAVNVFGGFTRYMYTNLRDSFIYTQSNGHLTIFKKGFLTKGELDPLKYLFTETETKTIQDLCSKDKRVLVVTPQLCITGMISNGTISTIFIAMGKVPSDDRLIRSKATGLIKEVKLFSGKQLEDEIVYGVGLSTGLAKKLGLNLGSRAIAMSSTVDGFVNALDIEAFQLFNASIETLGDKLMLVPLKFAQSLYDTKGIDRLTVLLNDGNQTETMRTFLEEALKQKGLKVEIKIWKELSSFYRKVKEMFDVIFGFIFIVVFIIVVMSVINTISMAVMERTNEIGTLRAIGLKRRGVVKLFAIESGLLAVIGSVVGIGLTLLSWTGIKILKPTWIPPHISIRIPLEVYLAPDYMVLSFLFLFLLSLVAAIFPAKKAASMNIIDALGHV